MLILKVASRPFTTINTIEYALHFSNPHRLTTFDPTDTHLQTYLHQNVFYQPARPGRFPRHWTERRPQQSTGGSTQGSRRVTSRECKCASFVTLDSSFLTCPRRFTLLAATQTASLQARPTPLTTAMTQSCQRRYRRSFLNQSRRVRILDSITTTAC